MLLPSKTLTWGFTITCYMYLFDVFDESFTREANGPRGLKDVDSSLGLELVIDEGSRAKETRTSLTVHAVHQNRTRSGALTHVTWG